MDRPSVLDALFDFVWKSLVDRLHVGPERVAADVGDLVRAKHGAERGLLTPGYVAMPVVLDADGVFVLGESNHVGRFASG